MSRRPGSGSPFDLCCGTIPSNLKKTQRQKMLRIYRSLLFAKYFAAILASLVSLAATGLDQTPTPTPYPDPDTIPLVFRSKIAHDGNVAKDDVLVYRSS